MLGLPPKWIQHIFKDSKAHGTFHIIGASSPGEIAGSFLQEAVSELGR